MRVTARARRMREWWAIEVVEVPGVFTQVRRLDQVAAMTADAVATMLDLLPDEVQVDVRPELTDDVRVEVEAARRASREAVVAQQVASSSARAAVGRLRADGLTVRDVAVVLGISHQRVSQLERS